MLTLAALFSFCLNNPAQLAKEETKGPQKIKAGVYITQVFGLKSNAEFFQADFWFWLNYPGKPVDYFSKMEFFNSLEARQITRDTEEIQGVNWDAAKYSNKIAKSWDVAHFPFDKHTLELQIESTRPISEIILEPDTKDFGINPTIAMDGWKVLGKRLRVDRAKYTSRFGAPNPENGEEFHRAILSIEIRRDALSLFFKLHAGVYVTFAITMLSYFMSPAGDDIFSARMGLIVAMLFASLVNLQIVDNTIGQTNSLSLPDKIHIFTMINLLVAIAATLYSRRFCERGKKVFAKEFDRICLGLQSLAYLGLNIILILLAAYS